MAEIVQDAPILNLSMELILEIVKHLDFPLEVYQFERTCRGIWSFTGLDAVIMKDIELQRHIHAGEMKHILSQPRYARQLPMDHWKLEGAFVPTNRGFRNVKCPYARLRFSPLPIILRMIYKENSRLDVILRILRLYGGQHIELLNGNWGHYRPTALTAAVHYRRPEVVYELVKMGCDMRGVSSYVRPVLTGPDWAQDPLTVALDKRNRQDDIAQYLLRNNFVANESHVLSASANLMPGALTQMLRQPWLQQSPRRDKIIDDAVTRAFIAEVLPNRRFSSSTLSRVTFQEHEKEATMKAFLDSGVPPNRHMISFYLRRQGHSVECNIEEAKRLFSHQAELGMVGAEEASMFRGCFNDAYFEFFRFLYDEYPWTFALNKEPTWTAAETMLNWIATESYSDGFVSLVSNPLLLNWVMGMNPNIATRHFVSAAAQGNIEFIDMLIEVSAGDVKKLINAPIDYYDSFGNQESALSIALNGMWHTANFPCAVKLLHRGAEKSSIPENRFPTLSNIARSFSIKLEDKHLIHDRDPERYLKALGKVEADLADIESQLVGKTILAIDPKQDRIFRSGKEMHKPDRAFSKQEVQRAQMLAAIRVLFGENVMSQLRPLFRDMGR
ncbi:hypothetical protein AB5N19_12802 [Seiridium cardinale]|uniref:Ankyrin n=1 Tax=Seiridium cardinale TaxID=138064 RepID=A0ABR2Y0H9_9PEZI